MKSLSALKVKFGYDEGQILILPNFGYFGVGNTVRFFSGSAATFWTIESDCFERVELPADVVL